MNQECEAIIRRLFDGTIPEVPEIYLEAEKYYRPETIRVDVIPYLMMSMYTEDEMKMVVALPGSAEEVTVATGFDKEYVSSSLSSLAARGMLMYTPKGYTRLPTNIPLMLDQVYFAHEGTKQPYTQKLLDQFLLMRKLIKHGEERGPAPLLPIRIIPKWRSIKNLPGVMKCENMKELMLTEQEAGTLITERCTCKVTASMWAEGKYPAAGDDKPGYTYEGTDLSGGHCYQVGRLGAYYRDYIGGHAVQTKEEALKKLDEAENSDCIYTATDSREVTSVCCCNFDYCAPYLVGAGYYLASRFRPTRKEDKCINCNLCVKTCRFSAIDSKTLDIDPEKCKGCGNCVVKCPSKALKMETAHPVEWIKETGNAFWFDK